MRRFVRFGLIGLVLWRLFGSMPTPRFSGPQEHPWRLPGFTVYVGELEFLVRQVGDPANPDVVLIHGLGGASLSEWYEIGPLLMDDYRLTIVENRNHGLAPRHTRRFEIDDLADDVAAVMDHVGVTTASVVGYSMGGTVAQALAHRHPDRVDRLALIATFTHHPFAWRWARHLGVYVVRAWERLTGTGTPEVRAGYLIVTGAVRRRHERFIWEETHRRDPEGGAASTLALLRFDSRPWVRDLDMPILVVIPGSDFLIPPRWQRDMAAEIGADRVLELDGAGHEVVWSHPKQIADALRSFFCLDGGGGA